jgi:hypothetical protein
MGGFDFFWLPQRPGAWRKFASFWESFYSYALIWTYNPASLYTKRLVQLRRFEIWISRDKLNRLYRSRPLQGAPAALEQRQPSLVEADPLAGSGSDPRD